MARRGPCSLLAGLVLLASFLPRPGSGTARAQEVAWRTGAWAADSLGNHRAVVRVTTGAEAVRVRIPWRRRDIGPENKEVLLYDPAGRRIDDLVRIAIGREEGLLAFRPAAGPGEYFVYYLPYVSSGRNYPRVSYPEPVDRADPAWRARHRLREEELPAGAWRRLPEAVTVALEAVDDFHSFWPMEVIATGGETAALKARFPDRDFLLFPESRSFPIRMTDDLPQRWTAAGPSPGLRLEAQRGEYVAFQVGVWAMGRFLEEVRVVFTPLVGAGGRPVIPADSLTCFNTGGVDWTGRAFRRSVAVDSGKVQALWCGLQVPPEAAPGSYTGRVSVGAAGQADQGIALEVVVAPGRIEHGGDDEPERLSRLRWLDSRIALEETVVAPYTPVEVNGSTVRVLGREVRLGDHGLPRSIRTFFAPTMTRLTTEGRELLAAPVRLDVTTAQGRVLPWTGSGPRFTSRREGEAVWEDHARAEGLALDVRAEMEFDGTIEFQVALSADRPVPLQDVSLEIPLVREVARYMMGLGYRGGERPASFEWSWGVEKNQDSAWIGDVNAGLQFLLKDEHYARPLNTNFYQLKPLVMPLSWANDGRGGCRMREEGETFQVTCFSGPRTLRSGETLRFDFRLTVTPFRPIDTAQQWSTRFHHRFAPVEEIQAMGANVINVHHATEINPFINYPFLRPAEMKAYIEQAHKRGMRVKIYYTVRELANRAPELFMLRSLGSEVLASGPGGGYSWLQEHLGSDYIAGWFVPRYEDAAMVTSGVSRWHNYYLEGLDWLVRNVGIDGLYIDDVAFDRTVMKRVRRILDAGGPGQLIDLHSANQFNPRDGFANSANLYLEHFPYLDRLWFGEYFDYGSAPDFWLVEVSGIPFGLMGEMLQDGGNPWRGLLFGMTNRQPYDGHDPSPIWRLWDAFRIQESEMIGWWVPGGPVGTGRRDVLATTWQAEGRALLALASWAETPVEIRLEVDWSALGLDPRTVEVTAPAVAGLQEAARLELRGGAITLTLEPGGGMILQLQGRPAPDGPVGPRP